MDIVMLERDQLYEIIEEAVKRIKAEQQITEDRWISGPEAMRLLRIKSKSTLQMLRDTGAIRFTQPQHKIILYERESINNYLNTHAKNTF